MRVRERKAGDGNLILKFFRAFSWALEPCKSEMNAMFDLKNFIKILSCVGAFFNFDVCIHSDASVFHSELIESARKTLQNSKLFVFSIYLHPFMSNPWWQALESFNICYRSLSFQQSFHRNETWSITKLLSLDLLSTCLQRVFNSTKVEYFWMAGTLYDEECNFNHLSMQWFRFVYFKYFVVSKRYQMSWGKECQTPSLPSGFQWIFPTLSAWFTWNFKRLLYH